MNAVTRADLPERQQQVLVSFCNLPTPQPTALLTVNPFLGTCEPFLIHSATWQASATGLYSNEQQILALVEAHGTHLAAIHPSTCALKFIQALPEIQQGHSILAWNRNVYIISTGTDEVLCYELTPAGLAHKRVVWQASSSGTDTHHINSIAVWNDHVIISAFGPRASQTWASANEGYIHDITADIRLKVGIEQPHSLSIANEQIYYCESQKKRFCSLQEPILSLDGYTRGVCWLNNDVVCIGTSIGRHVPHQPELIANPRDAGAPRGSCGISVVQVSNRKVLAYLNLHWFGPEIYDLVVLPQEQQARSYYAAPDISQGSHMSTCLNPLEHPVALSAARRLTPVANWHPHIPLGMFLVSLLKPSLLVELGTHMGDSYCAFCQAVQELRLDTRCYAIDTWQGDAQAGLYGPDVLAELRRFHDPLYGGFSELIPSTFDDALARFADHSIDLLHIDGCHTYEAVKYDFICWLPKMSPRGVVLFHDINARERDFGVWRFWDELKPTFPHLEFLHGHGLGVLAVGAEQTPEIRAWFDAAPQDKLVLREFFFRLGSSVDGNAQAQNSTQAELRAHALSQELAAAQDAARTAQDTYSHQIRQLEQTVNEQTDHLDALSNHIEFMSIRERELRAVLQDAQAQLASRDGMLLNTQVREARLKDKEEAIAFLQAEVENLTNIVAARNEGIAWLKQELAATQQARAAGTGRLTRVYRRVRRSINGSSGH